MGFKSRWLAMATTLVLAVNCQAQNQQPQNFLTGVNPQNLTFTKINPSSAFRNPLTSPAGQGPFGALNFANIFRSFTFPLRFPPTVGGSQWPSLANSPYKTSADLPRMTIPTSSNR